MGNEVTEQESTEVAATSEPTSMLSIIERAATNADVGVEKIERLYQMYSDMQERQAKQQYNAAMADAQAQMRPISTDATNPQTKSRYASYNALDNALRPIYSKHGFSISYNTDDPPKENYVRVVALVSHRAGHTEKFRRDMPVTTTGIQGKPMMTQTHAMASAESYGMRYLLKGIFNVAVGEHDDDGNRAGHYETITDQQVADLDALIDDVKADREAFMKYCKITSLDQILAKNYDSVVKALERKRSAQ